MPSTTRRSVTSIMIGFATQLSCWLAVILFIEMAPKDSLARSSLRLIYMLTYFGAILVLLTHIRHGLPQVLRSIRQWRYEDAPPDIQRASKSVIEEFEFALACQIWVVTSIVVASAALVLNEWFQMPDLVTFLLQCVWWLSLLAMIVFIYWLPTSLERIFLQYRFLRRQVQMCDFYQPRHWLDPFCLGPDAPDPRFVLKAPKEGFVLAARPWTYKRLCENVVVFGSTGSGKTLCVMNSLLDKLIGSKRMRRAIGGLVLDYKGDFKEKVRRLCERHNRTSDLLVLSPESGLRWNPLDSQEPEHEIAAMLVATMKALGQRDGQNSFFADQSEALLANAIALLRFTNEVDQPPTLFQLYCLINEEEMLQHRLELFHERLALSTSVEPSLDCERFFTRIFAMLPVETRQCVIATLNNMLDPLCTPRLASILEGRSSFQLEELTDASKILYLDLPSSRHPKSGRVLGVLLKLAFYAEVRRKQPAKRNYSFLFADEFQEFFTSDKEALDTRFFSISREYHHANIIATQNLNNLTMQDDKRDAVMSFLSNAKIKIFLQNDNKDTNQYASELFGQHVIELGGGHSTSQAQLVSKVNPSDFVVLKKPVAGFSFCEGIILDTTDSKVDLMNRSIRFPVFPILSQPSQVQAPHVQAPMNQPI